MIEVAAFGDPLEAQIALGALRSAGIEAALFDAAVSAAYAGALSHARTRLMVIAEDANAARALLGHDAGVMLRCTTDLA